MPVVSFDDQFKRNPLIFHLIMNDLLEIKNYLPVKGVKSIGIVDILMICKPPSKKININPAILSQIWLKINQ